MAHHTINHIRVGRTPDGRKALYIDTSKGTPKANQRRALREHLFKFADERRGSGKRNFKNLVFKAGTKDEIKITLGNKANLFIDGEPVSRFNAAIDGGMNADLLDTPRARREDVRDNIKFETKTSADKQKLTRETDLKIGTLDPEAGLDYGKWNKFIKGEIHHAGPARITSELLQTVEKINNPKWKPEDGLTDVGKRFARNIETRLGVDSVNSILNMEFYPDDAIHKKAHRVLEESGLDTKKIKKTLKNVLQEVPKQPRSKSKRKVSVIDESGKVKIVPEDIGLKTRNAKINRLYSWVNDVYSPGIERVKNEVGDFSLKGKGLGPKGASAIARDPNKLQLLINQNKITTPEGTIQPEIKIAPKIPKPKNGINLQNVRRALAISGQSPWVPMNIASDVLGGVLDIGQAVVNPTPSNITHAGLGGSQALLSGLSPVVAAAPFPGARPLAIGMYGLSNKLGQAQMQLGISQASLEAAKAINQKKLNQRLNIQPDLKIKP